jgi:hypothetical protein
MAGIHEDLTREHEVSGSSNRSFGFVMAAAGLLFGFSKFVRGTGPIRWYLVGPGLGFLVLALVAPQVLGPLNKAWTKLGLLLGRITTPIVLFVFFTFILTPVALFMRLFGKDPLRLKRSSEKSYWIERTPPGPAPKSLRQQF